MLSSQHLMGRQWESGATKAILYALCSLQIESQSKMQRPWELQGASLQALICRKWQLRAGSVYRPLVQCLWWNTYFFPKGDVGTELRVWTVGMRMPFCLAWISLGAQVLKVRHVCLMLMSLASACRSFLLLLLLLDKFSHFLPTLELVCGVTEPSGEGGAWALESTHSSEMKTPGIDKHPSSGPSDLLGGVCDRPNPKSL